MKIISLLPAATEIVYLLGLEKSLVGVSDDSDYPPQVLKLPKITASLIPQNLSSLAIDKKVKKSKHSGVGVFHINQKLLAKLKPDLILTQELCSVCAISFTQIKKAARILDGDVKIISLEPENIEGIFENIRMVGKYTGREKAAEEKIGKLKKRIRNIQKKLLKSYILNHKSILVIEWLSPIMVAAHWVPEMVEFAGGRALFAKAGERSREISWDQVLTADPDVIIIAPCGFDIRRTKKELNLITRKKGYKSLKAVKNKQVFLMDGNAYLTRPGPRIVDGLEILSEIFNPKLSLSQHNEKNFQEI